MRLLIQRVSSASVTVEGAKTGEIGKGLLVFVGVGKDDTESQALGLAEKCLSLRIFGDAGGKMNLSLRDIAGELLAVSQFTLYGDLKKGHRPNFTEAAPPEVARRLYECFCTAIRDGLGKVQTGIFGARMEVALVNDGPVTFWVEATA